MCERCGGLGSSSARYQGRRALRGRIQGGAKWDGHVRRARPCPRPFQGQGLKGMGRPFIISSSSDAFDPMKGFQSMRQPRICIKGQASQHQVEIGTRRIKGRIGG